MKLVAIPADQYDDYRLAVMFAGYKWDPQFMDHNTIAKHVLVISEAEHAELVSAVEQLGRETVDAEEVINANLSLTRKLGLPRKIRQDIKRMTNYQSDRHIRLMRFDFHPLVSGGWALSEVNSDVPGGFAESSIMPEIAARLFPESVYGSENFAHVLVQAICAKVRPGGRIMLIHCTAYSDDRQVMQFLGDQLESRGFSVIYGAVDHLRFDHQEAVSILDHQAGKIDGIVRFTPLEWMIDVKPKHWEGYFDTLTPSCNHPIAIFMQSKKMPLLWNELEVRGVDLSTWRRLLPETIPVQALGQRPGFIFKPVWGRVGEGIAIEEACKGDEYQKILRDVKRHPKRYLAQKKFDSRPLIGAEGQTYHVCLGAYNVDGQAAGYYARISETPRIDSNAADIPVLIERNRP